MSLPGAAPLEETYGSTPSESQPPPPLSIPTCRQVAERHDRLHHVADGSCCGVGGADRGSQTATAQSGYGSDEVGGATAFVGGGGGGGVTVTALDDAGTGSDRGGGGGPAGESVESISKPGGGSSGVGSGGRESEEGGAGGGGVMMMFPSEPESSLVLP